jgi:Type I phosphodiesterase / nucleotide pyrophosphatase
VPTVFEQAQTLGIRSYAIGQPRYQHSGFTQAVLRGAEFIPAQRIGARFAEAGAILENPSLSLTYLYVHELDVAAHAHGWQSDAWLADLEAVDSEVAGLAASLGPRDGLVVTADHGVIDVPASGHVFFDTAPELIDGVELIGGEPRCLQLYLDEDATSADRDRLAEAWRRIEGDRSWIATREEAVRAGWFGSRVDETVLPRIGDVLVAARKQIAYYDSRDPNVAAQAMVGQHGSLSQEETRVPLIRLGVFEL